MNKILQYTTKKNLIISTFILVIGFLFLNILHHPLSILSIKQMSGGHIILNLLPFYGATTGYEYLESYPSEAVTIYKRILLFDLIILIPSYLSFFFIGLGYFGKKIMVGKNRIFSKLFLLPIIAALLNIIEDAIVYFLLNYLPNQLGGLMSVLGIITTIKLILFVICMVLIVMFFVKSFFQGNTNKKNNKI